MMHDCFQKTEKGREEIATRKYGLSLRFRSILLLINGMKTCKELVQTYPGLGLSEALLNDLEQQGFISSMASVSELAQGSTALARECLASLGADTCICTQTEVTAEDEEPEPTAAYNPSATSVILETFFPADLPILPNGPFNGAYMTAADDYLKRPSLHEAREEHPTLFDAIKSCYLNALPDVPPAVSASLLKSLGNAQTTRALANLRPAFMKALRAAKGKTAAAKQAEELELLLFAIEA